VKEVFAGNHPIPVTEANIYGSLSLFFWALIIRRLDQVRHLHHARRQPRRGRHHGADRAGPARCQTSRGTMKMIMIVGVLGAAMFYGDGMVTPAISVLSAVEGLEVATPALQALRDSDHHVVLFGLFFVQKSGTADDVGAFFGPVMLLWFSVLALLGISTASWTIRPFSPRSIRSTVSNSCSPTRRMSLVAMGNVVLAVTGAERFVCRHGALWAQADFRAWFAVCAAGAGAQLFWSGGADSGRPGGGRQPFLPFGPGLGALPADRAGHLATVIASQAVISGAFSVTRQAMQLGFVPRMEVQHTSENEPGKSTCRPSTGG
jgi:KUP system potassium uptake protein